MEWSLFFVAVLFCFALLYFPGYLGARGAGFSPRLSFSFAPVVSLVLFCTIGVLFAAVGVFSSGLRVLLCASALCAALFFSRLIAARKADRAFSAPLVRLVDGKSVVSAVLYVAVSFIAAVLLYVVPLDGPASYMQTYDNVHHYGLVQSFLSSGEWSSLDTALYLSDYDTAISPFVDDGGYYPSAWHVLVAMISSIFDVSVPFAANVVNVVFVSFVFPLSVRALVECVFGRDSHAVWFGALCAPAFSAFPWILLLQWPLYPNFVSMALLPVSMLFFIEATSRGRSRLDRVRFAAAFVLTIFAFFFSQPNTAFSVGIALIPYCAWRCGDLADVIPGRMRGRMSTRVAFMAFFVLLSAALWFLLYKAPFLQGLVNFQWDAVCSLPAAVKSALALSQNTSIPQYALSVVVLFGLVCCFMRREYRWLACSYVLFGVIFVVAYGSEGFLKHLLAGFWYTDYYRIAATMAIIGTLPAAYGLSRVFRALSAVLCRLGRRPSLRPFSARLLAAALSIVFIAAVFFPAGHNVFAWLRANAVNIGSSGAGVPFDGEEQDFLEEVRSVVGDEALLINMPYDGSMYSYGAEGANLYYRYISGYGGETETRESRIIREHLKDVAVDSEVQHALESLGVRYFVFFGDEARELKSNPDYVEGDWRGIEGVTDDTPGFELVLKKGDMRLYRIAF